MAREWFADPRGFVAATGAGGTATPVEGGYRVTGRWPFERGAHHASLFTRLGLAARPRSRAGDRRACRGDAPRRPYGLRLDPGTSRFLKGRRGSGPRFAGDHERHLEVASRIRRDLGW
ncbi:hypothetical protein [Enhydrobacter sp.]|uniref:hypothetical protein n=1 Tax=Enhydrobacter sp. TaxID=1894999 RepID=UPI002618997B|nr:hypothetical protein [Enhydrobacter sp.]WIM09262.1 MAG: hypothetical protein OJF58_000213 [Enhydrobacter sp.]